MNGLVIPRDASQQINEGLLVDENRNWNNLNKGDLMFFGYYKDGQAGGAIKTDQQQAQGLTAKAIELLDFVDKSTGG